ncbi:hypothetical protein HYW39_00040, partial [Candidatus Curtissbacteria bacterium]|nr:hypothetical protein [Candidatus Curtissbacteria bacterium]
MVNTLKNIFHESRRVLAKVWLAFHKNVQIIGITGSYGKTNTTAAIAAVLSEKFKVLATDLNLDTRFNIPITVLRLSDQKKLVLEYGIDKRGEMDYHLFVAKPSIAVVTGITPVHADSAHLGSLENIIREKGKLAAAVPKSGWVIINWEDQDTREIALVATAKIIFYGENKDKCQFWASDVRTSLSGTSFTMHYQDKAYKIKIPLIGHHHS